MCSLGSQPYVKGILPWPSELTLLPFPQTGSPGLRTEMAKASSQDEYQEDSSDEEVGLGDRVVRRVGRWVSRIELCACLEE